VVLVPKRLKTAIGFYIGERLESTYGAAASIIVVLIWVYYSSQIVLMGAQVTHAFAKHRGSITKREQSGLDQQPDSNVPGSHRWTNAHLARQQANASRPRLPSRQLSPLDADHYGTGANHIEFNRCGAAHVDDSTTAIRATIYDTHDYCLAVVMVSDPHLRSKRQCAMGGGKPVWAGSFSAGGAPAAIERCATRFSVNVTDRYRQ
jgi:Virulence factor BrkB